MCIKHQINSGWAGNGGELISWNYQDEPFYFRPWFPGWTDLDY